MIGQKSKDEALLTLIERQTRKELIVRLAGKDAESVEHGLNKLLQPFGDHLSYLFKTIKPTMALSLARYQTMGKKLVS